MKAKFTVLALLLTSLFGYLEWGQSNRSFLFEAEAEVLAKLVTDPLAAIHPLTLLPLFGQVVLIVTLFQKVPHRRLTMMGIISLGVLLAVILVIGLLAQNAKMIASTLPFFITLAYWVRN